MTMTKTDKAEIKEMFQEGIHNLRELFEEKLDRIESQTTLTNGRVTKHDTQINKLEHDVEHTIVSCPQDNRISAMWEDRIVKKGVQGWKIVALSMAVSIVSVIATVVAVFEFILKYKI